MNQEAESVEKTEKNIILRSFNLEMPPQFHEAIYAKYEETLKEQEKALMSSPYTFRRSKHKIAYRSFVRDLFYAKIESGEWKI